MKSTNCDKGIHGTNDALEQNQVRTCGETPDMEAAETAGIFIGF